MNGKMAPSKSRKVAIVGSRSVGESLFVLLLSPLPFPLSMAFPRAWISRVLMLRPCLVGQHRFHMPVVVVVGAGAGSALCSACAHRLLTRPTGKSSLAVQFVDGHFVESYYPTIENTFSKVIKYKGQEFSTEIIDTAGQVSAGPCLAADALDRMVYFTMADGHLQDEYSIMNSKHFIGIHGYVLVYSVASKSSFEMVQVIREKLLNHLVRFMTPLPPPAQPSLLSTPLFSMLAWH